MRFPELDKSLHTGCKWRFLRRWPLPLDQEVLGSNPSRATVQNAPRNASNGDCRGISVFRRVWNRFSPSRPFEAFFLDDDYDRQYQSERRIGAILALFTGLAIFIACLGLFALAAFTAQQRTKEIGVRKVLGASAPSIVLLLSKEFTRLVILGTVVAAPIAFLLMDRWLEDFAYRIELSWTTFVLAGLAAMVIAWMTVSHQSLRTALTDPVDALKYE